MALHIERTYRLPNFLGGRSITTEREIRTKPYKVIGEGFGINIGTESRIVSPIENRPTHRMKRPRRFHGDGGPVEIIRIEDKHIVIDGPDTVLVTEVRPGGKAQLELPQKGMRGVETLNDDAINKANIGNYRKPGLFLPQKVLKWSERPIKRRGRIFSING